MKRVVVAIYIDPDFYPPSINAVLNLAERVNEVIVISRNNAVKDYPYPSNVILKKIGKPVSVRVLEKQAVWKKVFYFFRFTSRLYREGMRTDTDLLLLYDSIALFSFFLLKKIGCKKKAWYHNHDMPDSSLKGKVTIGGLAAACERRAMSYIDYFSLPSKDRLKYYPQLKKGIRVFILPNYPSLKVYGKPKEQHSVKEVIRIIYQGFIGKGHSIEEFISLLNNNFSGQQWNLILKGSVTPDYQSFLTELAQKYRVEDKLIWAEIGPYSGLPSLTASCDIGIGINMNSDRVSQAQNTASNKVYEYAACGLPVILYDSEQYVNHLGKYPWVFFTDGSIESLKKIISNIIGYLPEIGKIARQDFEKSLNFEVNFEPVLQQVLSNDQDQL